MIFPLELLEIVVDDVRLPSGYIDHKTLRSFCAVSHLLRDLAMKRVSRLIILDTRKRKSKSLLELELIQPNIEGWKGILHYACRVWFNLNARCYACGPEVDAPSKSKTDVAKSSCSVHLIPLLDAIRQGMHHISGIDWYMPPGICLSDDLRASVGALFQLPTVKSLQLHGASLGPINEVLRGTYIQNLEVIQEDHGLDQDYHPLPNASISSVENDKTPLPALDKLLIHYGSNDFDIHWPTASLRRLRSLTAYITGECSLEATCKLFIIAGSHLTRLDLSLNYYSMRWVSGATLGQPLQHLSNLTDFTLVIDEALDDCGTMFEVHQHMDSGLNFLELAFIPIPSLQRLELKLIYSIFNPSPDLVASWLRQNDAWKRLDKNMHGKLFPALQSFSFGISIQESDYSQKDELKKLTFEAIRDVLVKTAKKIGENFKSKVGFYNDWAPDDA